jgi:hypothetical protein
MSIDILNFPEQTYLGIRINQIIIGLTLTKEIREQHKQQLRENKINLVFVTILLKLRVIFSEAIKHKQLNLTLREMERLTVDIAKNYCKSI